MVNIDRRVPQSAPILELRFHRLFEFPQSKSGFFHFVFFTNTEICNYSRTVVPPCSHGGPERWEVSHQAL